MIVYCDEPEGPIHRCVEQLKPEIAAVEQVWQRMLGVPNIFERMTPEWKAWMMQGFWKFWTVDDVGVLCFDPWVRGNAHVHVTFWDKRLRGRERLCAVVAVELMKRYKVERLFTTIPREARVILAFAQRVGFRPVSQNLNGKVVLAASAGNFTMNKPGGSDGH